ncbi:pirin family protein [Streptomyces antarcticus]|uniref:pirin family protein n=1 Tax=Streptomyces antarcticus TaxID=2996458 RepID=UPI00226EADC7|nr:MULTISPECIES: pirin family protein [unclassified Streptomyces]MCY0942460.1 pirin family protein [Streptomyces sp. H34-AA3]MCY0948699.1 pirin family protein [Streptomyces sp. H27-S2]MCZ4083975.1 pirin family protein [Streptomyces sp. H34-S5]
MIDVRRGADRYEGGDVPAGITTRHAFSFGSFYDPDNLRFGPVLACNEETLAPGAGFDEHPHSHTEIVTWVVEGELTHQDTTGEKGLVGPGDVQRLGAGSGVRHAERNDGERRLRFVQLWLAPLAAGGAPSYEVVRGLADGTPYAVPAAGAVLHVRRPGAGERVAVPAAERVYLHVVRGDLRLDGEELGPGDSVRITAEKGLEVTAGSPGELLILELP